MVLYPDAFQKAQAELDRVVGQDRLPEFSDKEALPYVCAIVQEVLRWNPVTPLGEHICFKCVYLNGLLSL